MKITSNFLKNLTRLGVLRLIPRTSSSIALLLSCKERSQYEFPNKTSLSGNLSEIQKKESFLKSGKRSFQGTLQGQAYLAGGAGLLREREPLSHMQWYLENWNVLGQQARFPFQLEQRNPFLRMSQYFSKRTFQDLKSLDFKEHNDLQICDSRLPKTLFQDDIGQHLLLKGEKLPTKDLRNEKAERAFVRELPLIYVLDGMPDLSHTELARRIQFSKNQVLEASVHGTHIAGILAGKADDFGMVGFGSHAKLEWSALSSFYLNEAEVVEIKEVTLELKNILSKLDKGLINDDLPVIVYLGAVIEYFESENFDLSSLPQQKSDFLNVIQLLLKRNVILINPAGNTLKYDSEDSSLHSGKNILSEVVRSQKMKVSQGEIVLVSATGICGNLAFFSKIERNENGLVWAAPGEKILSTLPGNEFGFQSGTSQAAAQISALFAKATRGMGAKRMSAKELVGRVAKSSREKSSGTPLLIMPNFLEDFEN